MKKLVALAVISAGLISCARYSVEVAYDGGRTRIMAVNDNIIRVTSVPSGCEFMDGESLMTVPGLEYVPLSVEKTDSTVVVSTSGVTAIVSRKDGAVSFYGADGRLLTAEHSRSFSPISVEGTEAWTVRQTFDSPSDEAFFGLGQHQADEWNYKGRNEELYQYNTKISLPFVVSNRRYGLLWDSNCFCRWGDPRDYAQIGEVFKLYDADGVEGALTGTYTPAAKHVGIRIDGVGGDLVGEYVPAPLVRRETALAQEFLDTPQCAKVRNAPDFDFEGSSVLYEGWIEPSESGIFRFYLYYAGYTKVFIDGRQVMPEIWRTSWNPNGRKFEVELTAGVKVPVRIEWQPDGEISYCGLRVLSPAAEDEQARMSWWGEMQDQIDYYVIGGDNIDNVIGGYRTLTGKAQIMPKWVLGYWQSRERYTTQDEVLGTLSRMRELNIPIDNIVQDWQYWKPDQWGSHEFDETRYPDPKAMVDSIHALGGRFMISVWPKFYRNTEHFKELDAHGWIYQTAIRDSIIDWIGYEQSFYDAYSEGARKLFWSQMREHLYPLGVDAWWMDASEPNLRDCTDMDYRKELSGPTALGPSTKYFNAYALMNAEAIYNGQRSVDPDRRVFLLTRNGFPGLQRYSTASWSGDIGTRWEDMKAQISAGLNFSISGIPFWTQDVGGFSVEKRFMNAESIFMETGKVNADMEEWREMQARWHEWGIFCPIYRAHGQWPHREPYYVAPEGEPAYEAILAADRLRYSLLPYIYTMTSWVHFNDYTIMRPLVMDFTDDTEALGISDQYMFGPAFMVCPVYEYKARSREVYLPEGLWYDWNGFAPVDGGRRFVADAPYGHIPLYVRAGSIVPCGPDIQFTAEDDGSALRILIFTGKDVTYALYEDEGVNYNYEKGAYSLIPMLWDDAASTLTLGERQGSFDGMAKVKSLEIKVVSPDGVRVEQLEYTGEKINIKI